MEFRRLGRSGLTVSAIACGNWLTHGERIDEEQARACVHAALDVGITTFDTADVYAGTRAEEVLGRAIAGQRREGIEICTKVYWRTGPDSNDEGLGRKHITESIHNSLRRLDVDYVDLYQAHRYDTTTPLEETMSVFADLVHAGKVLYLGVSEWTAEQIIAGAGLARELRVPLVSNQPQYSMLWRVIEPAVVPACQREGLSQIVWSPLAEGVLTGKYTHGAPPPPGSRATYHSGDSEITHWLRSDVLTRVEKLKPLSAEAGLSMGALAVAWTLQNDNVASAIIGASRPEQVVVNAAGVGVRLDAELLRRIDDVLGDVVERDPTKTG